MKITFHPLARQLQRAWLRRRIAACNRHLDTIAAQRENDFEAERILHKEISEMRARLHAL